MGLFADNHDVRRFMGEQGATQSGFKNSMAFIMTARGIPYVYYGSELGFTGGSENMDANRESLWPHFLEQ